MKTRTLSASVLAAAFVGILGAAPARAQDSDDFSFAKRLAFRGWFDLAKDVCDRIERDPSLPRDVRSALPILLAEIELAKAEREPDAEKVIKHLSASIALLQRFIADEPNHSRIFDAQINIGSLKSRKAKALVSQMDRAASADEHDRKKKEAIALYGEVTADFEASVQNWKRLPESDQVNFAIMDARLETERARFEHATINGLDEVIKKKLLLEAVKNLEDFEIDYGDQAAGFEAILLDAKCLLELGETAKAETKLKSAMELRNILADNKIPRSPYHNQIIFGTYLAMSQLYNKTNRPREAKAFILGVFKSDPIVDREWIGLALRIEKVEALSKLRDAGWLPEAQAVIAADPDGPFGRLMRERLGKMGGPANTMAPAQSLRVAESSMEKGRFREAMVTLRQTIEACRTEQDRATHGAKALYFMGQCLVEMGRNYEAAINFEKVHSLAAKNEQAPLALWQAVLCYSEEFDQFADPSDETSKNRVMDILLKEYPGHAVTDNIYYLKARTLESQKKLVEAAEMYLKVPERATAFERSMVRGGYCLRMDGFIRFAKAKDAAAKQAISDQFKRAEEIFQNFLKRAADPKFTPEGPEAQRDRTSLVVAVNQELAYLYNHEAVGKAKEALEFLDKVAKDIQPDDERIAQIHLLRIQSQLVLLKNDDAVKTMELLFDHFPTLKVTAQACKSVAIRLNEITEKWFAANPGKEPDEATKENLKKVSRYYSTWLRGAIRFGLDARPSDVLLVADTLYMTAKRLNGIPDSVDSFMDRRGLVQYPNYFEDADFVHTLLSSEQFKGKIPEKDRQFLMSRRAKCLGFLANQADTWSRAKTAYEDIIREAKIEDEKGTFSASTLVSNPELVRVYIEFATVYLELGRWNKIHYDNAIQRFGNVAGISAHNSEPWWIAQYQGLRAHFLRGKDKDILTAQIGLKMLQENYPNFDEGKYGLKEKFGELKKSIEMTGGK